MHTWVLTFGMRDFLESDFINKDEVAQVHTAAWGI